MYNMKGAHWKWETINIAFVYLDEFLKWLEDADGLEVGHGVYLDTSVIGPKQDVSENYIL